VAEKVKLIIAGIGLVGKRHADAIRLSEVAELSGIVEPSELGKQYSKQYNIPCYPTLAEMFSAQTPDGVILATPTPLHVEQGLECIRNHCPVLIEKPLAVKAQEGEALVKTAEEEGVPVLVGHHRRHNPLIQKARAIIDEGLLGDIRAVHANCWFYKPDDYFEIAPWRKLKGAGPISVNLVHDVDLLRYLCGEVVSVQAQATQSQRGFENEDVAAAVLKFESGVIGTITVSDSVVSPWSWELTSSEYPIYPQTSEFCYLVGGSKASLSVPELKLWSHEEAPNWWSPINGEKIPKDTSDPLINQIIHFANVIAGTEKPLVTSSEGFKTLQIIEAIQKAAESGETQHISQPPKLEIVNG
jgi:predicted dehydrogenase